jgi:hypothetical protein
VNYAFSGNLIFLFLPPGFHKAFYAPKLLGIRQSGFQHTFDHFLWIAIEKPGEDVVNLVARSLLAG